MNLFSTLFSTIILAARRLWNHRLLMLCLLAGLVMAVGLLALQVNRLDEAETYLKRNLELQPSPRRHRWGRP